MGNLLQLTPRAHIRRPGSPGRFAGQSDLPSRGRALSASSARGSQAVASDIRIKRIYDPASADDGARVLVDRLWPRGVRKSQAGIDLWLKDVAPSTALRRWYRHEPARWPEFRERYLAELKSAPEALGELLELSARGTVTLLFGARDRDHNQAVVLRELLLTELGARRNESASPVCYSGSFADGSRPK